MMVRRGRLVWCPGNVLEELNIIKEQHKSQRQAEAFEIMTAYSKVGRNVTYTFKPFIPGLEELIQQRVRKK